MASVAALCFLFKCKCGESHSLLLGVVFFIYEYRFYFCQIRRGGYWSWWCFRMQQKRALHYNPTQRPFLLFYLMTKDLNWRRLMHLTQWGYSFDSLCAQVVYCVFFLLEIVCSFRGKHVGKRVVATAWAVWKDFLITSCLCLKHFLLLSSTTGP